MTKHGLSLEDRFWQKVDRSDPDGCWPWTASTRRGYGQFNVGGGVIVDAHRVAFELAGGVLTDDLVIDHVCHTHECAVPWSECAHKRCCNPAHLVQTTQRQNVLRGSSPSALFAEVTHCPHGHEYSEANTYRTKNGKRQCRACWGRRYGHGHQEVRRGTGTP